MVILMHSKAYQENKKAPALPQNVGSVKHYPVQVSFALIRELNVYCVIGSI